MPTNAELLARHQAAVPRGVAVATSIYAQRAEGPYLWDIEGRQFIDFASGIAVLNTGHRHPRVLAAATDQMERFTHTAFQVSAYETYIALAERVNGIAPFTGPAKTVFFTTGAEAVENAVKVARAATGRGNIVAFTGAFHGRTIMTSALTGKVSPYKRQFGPMPGGVYHLPFPVLHPGGKVADTLKALDLLFKADIDAESVAAIIIEPIQGEGGFYEAPVDLLLALRAVCDRHGILLIADEIQSGFARTGRMFAIEHSGVEPDLVTIAKSLAGGFPISGLIGRSDIMDSVDPGGLGGTYAGNPVACAAALAVLDIIDEEKLAARARNIGDFIIGRLKQFEARNDTMPMGAIRGRGAMVAFELFTERNGLVPDAVKAKAVTVRALEEGLILLTCGNHANSVRILAPLTISDQVLSEGLDRLGRALTIRA